MPKQEEIIQTIVNYCWWLEVDDFETKEELRSDIEGELLPELHSQGVVIKVDRELPKNPIKVTTHLGLTEKEANTRQLESDCFMLIIQDQMLKAGYVATIPLIKGNKDAP